MRSIAIIPARGGSKGIPGKNVARVGGIPLVARAVRSAATAPSIDGVIVTTDDPIIATTARAAGAEVIERPAAISGDLASSESALVHVLEVLRARDITPEVVAFLQATSPFIDSDALDRAVRAVLARRYDSMFSAYESYGFLWTSDGASATGVNHNHTVRPRRQDREPHYQESGAFYVMRTDGFLEAGFRFFGRIGIAEVPAASGIEIDEVTELAAARALAAVFDGSEPVPVDALVMDFDGVHTPDTAIVDETGREAVVVSRSDGMGIALLRSAGLPMLILSREQNPVVAARAAKLGVEVAHDVQDKLPALQAWCAAHGLSLDRVAYIGNDLPDVPCLQAVGWPVVPADAHPTARSCARIVLTRAGGNGAIRELADRILSPTD
ncbi:MAG: cytidylyltransferase domain-containing protein [Propioniciclava sp.]